MFENEPLASGGGYLNIGIGYSAGSNSFANTSISFFPYHTIGVAQSFRFYPSRNFNWDVSARVGNSHNQFEGSIAAGLGFRF
jgi:hypothetical protein